MLQKKWGALRKLFNYSLLSLQLIKWMAERLAQPLRATEVARFNPWPDLQIVFSVTLSLWAQSQVLQTRL
jgi:hypothetical protein